MSLVYLQEKRTFHVKTFYILCRTFWSPALYSYRVSPGWIYSVSPEKSKRCKILKEDSYLRHRIYLDGIAQAAGDGVWFMSGRLGFMRIFRFLVKKLEVFLPFLIFLFDSIFF